MFRVTFRIEESGETRVVQVGREVEPVRKVGLPGSLPSIALRAGVEIDHSCGGMCACTTCHVKVVEGQASCPAPTVDEEDILTTARDRDADSRLACQCVPDGTEGVVVVIPRWHSGGSGGSVPVPAPDTDPGPKAVAAHAAKPRSAPESGHDVS